MLFPSAGRGADSCAPWGQVSGVRGSGTRPCPHQLAGLGITAPRDLRSESILVPQVAGALWCPAVLSSEPSGVPCVSLSESPSRSLLELLLPSIQPFHVAEQRGLQGEGGSPVGIRTLGTLPGVAVTVGFLACSAHYLHSDGAMGGNER